MTAHFPDWTKVLDKCDSEIPAWVVARVRELGPDARDRLLTILRESARSTRRFDIDDQHVKHAATLLQQFDPDDDLVSACLDLIHRRADDDDVCRELAIVVARAGAGVAPRLLAGYAALGDRDGPEAGHLLEALARCGVRDEAAFDAIADGLRRFPTHAARAAGHYGDVRALKPLIDFLDGLVEQGVDPSDDGWLGEFGADDVATAIGMLGRKLTRAQKEFLDAAMLAGFGEDDDELAEPPPRPAANAPCWCGSDRKYKKCHMAADEIEGGEEPVEDDERGDDVDEPPPRAPFRLV